MNFKEILELIDKVAEKGIGGIEIEQAGTKIRIEGRSSSAMQSLHQPIAVERGFDEAIAALTPQPRTSNLETITETGDESESGLHIITSPIVGTFYRTPNPESEAFVNVGDRITKGKILCIVEAMKLMNEIESDVDGTIVRIFPQNGQPIEYGEKLFAVKP